MLSIPPATTISASPLNGLSGKHHCFHIEAQTLLTVVQGMVFGRPAPMAACFAGA